MHDALDIGLLEGELQGLDNLYARFSTSATSSGTLTPRCSALVEKYFHTPLSMETGIRTMAPGGMW
ncbi:MAG TPA: hypothetical protein VGS58_18765 [Candidatus Sulfopaludibacter sp.]|nr:hypothetical protein [Candidatus Sulfopaludibacter sp.]